MGFFERLFAPKKAILPTTVRTLAEFEREVERSELPVIVDVWGPSCGPCKKLEPVLIEIATKHEGKVKVVEISTEADPRLLGELGVRATPTLIIYRSGGEELGRSTGFRPAAWFDDMIAAELG